MYITRSNQIPIYQSFDSPFVSALLGPRRVGKTTLVHHYAKQHSKNIWVFLNMDDRAERMRIEQNQLKAVIQEKAQQQIGKNPKIWVAIDEAQKCTALFDQIKLLYDLFKDKNAIKFILTGSGFLALHQLSAESLAGRLELHYLREFNLQESIKLKHPQKILAEGSLLEIACDNGDIKKLEEYVASRAPLRKLTEEALNEQLIWGGFPEILHSEETSLRHRYLSNYLQTYLEKDIRAISTISDLNLYQKLLEITAEQTGSLRQEKEVIEALGCSRDTLKKYRGFLSATLVYKEIYPFIRRSLKRIVKSPKGYLFNNGLISYLTGIYDKAILQKTGLIGYRFENWFLKELQVWLDREAKRSEIYYWRTSSGIEVDFVVEKKPAVFPFEVTYSDRLQDKKIKNLTIFLQEETNAKMGFYIYRGDFHYDKKSRICFIPAWAID
jgi:predicted AAA+ superfamily ATPase